MGLPRRDSGWTTTWPRWLDNSGSITVGDNGFFDDGGGVTNETSGTIDDNGWMCIEAAWNDTGCSLTNLGAVEVSGFFNVQGTLTNGSAVNSSSTFVVTGGLSMEGNGWVDNNGGLTVGQNGWMADGNLLTNEQSGWIDNAGLTFVEGGAVSSDAGTRSSTRDPARSRSIM